MRVIGIDPGTRLMGWGIIERQGTRLQHVAHGVIRTVPDSPLADRLVVIDDALERILEEHAPTSGAVEGLFFHKDAQAAAKLGHARGVAMLRLAKRGLLVNEYPPSKVKLAVVGKGNATKGQVALVVRALLRLSETPQADSADALAIALTHLNTASFDAAVAQAKAR